MTVCQTKDVLRHPSALPVQILVAGEDDVARALW